jgi:6-phosphogluconolactonase
MPNVRIVADPGELASVGAEEIVDGIRRAAGANRPFRIALAGGRTPRGVYERLAATDGAGDGAVDWSRTHVFWGDERAVPPDDPDSNYRMAREALLTHVPVPVRQVHRIQGDRPDPGDAAAAYEREIRDAFHLAPGEWPRFDLVLLGLGEDGHVASLFPGSDAVEERRHLVVAPFVERLGVRRISLTFPVINHAACVLFLVSGAAKAGILRAVIQGDDGPGRYPAQRVQPDSGSVVWLVDRAAAARLSVHA